MTCRWKAAFAALGLASLLAANQAASAQTKDEFYKGKSIDLIIGYPPGGANDVYARLVARYLGKYIPGSPSIIPRNMPGAGSFVAVNYVYAIAPKDGLTIGLGAPTIALDEKLGTSGVHFKTAELNWIGRLSPLVNIVMSRKSSPVKTIEDAEKTELTLSGTGAGSTVSIYPTVLNNVIGTKFKIIMGYAGSREAMLAMERGEAEGHSTAWDAVKAAKPDWIRDKQINILVQFALERDPELADVPTAIEAAKTEEQRAVLRPIVAASDIGEAFFTTPKTAPDRVETLRHAFDQAVKDPQLLADAKTMQMGVDPMKGEDLQKLVGSVANMSPELLKKVEDVYPKTGSK